MSASESELRRYFLGWQCRIRQISVREEGGRPLAGMRPFLTLEGSPDRSQVTTILVKNQPADAIAQFRHLVRKTPDCAQRYESAVRLLSAEYYQHPETFSDCLTAVFALGSALVEQLLAGGHCRLEFVHATQRFHLPCDVRHLLPASDGYEATYWHNLLFNPTLPAAVSVMEFQTDWASAYAEPPVT